VLHTVRECGGQGGDGREKKTKQMKGKAFCLKSQADRKLEERKKITGSLRERRAQCKTVGEREEKRKRVWPSKECRLK